MIEMKKRNIRFLAFEGAVSTLSSDQSNVVTLALQTDPELVVLRDESGFKELIARIKSR